MLVCEAGADSTNVAIVVGVVLGLTALVVIIVINVYLRLRRDRRTQAKRAADRPKNYEK